MGAGAEAEEHSKHIGPEEPQEDRDKVVHVLPEP
jgi:hypothetical protein